MFVVRLVIDGLLRFPRARMSGLHSEEKACGLCRRCHDLSSEIGKVDVSSSLKLKGFKLWTLS